MANFKAAYTPEEVKSLGVAKVREAYNALAEDYNKIFDMEYLICPVCGRPQKADTGFYIDDRFAARRFPVCKRCLQKIVEQRKTDKEEPNETKESVQKVLQLLNRPYYDDIYEQCVKGAKDGLKERNRTSPFATYVTMALSLPQFKGKTWKDSDFGSDGESFEVNGITSNKKPRKEIYKLFGSGFSNEDYLYLQDQYDDWRARTQVDSKSQETYIIRICFKLLDIWKAQRNNKDTKDLDKSLNDLMAAANLQPKQNVANNSSDTLTFGQLIEKWENEKPIPEVDEAFRDENHIGKYIDIFFRGHTSRMMGLKNAYSVLYDNYMKKFAVNKQEYDEDSDSETIFNQIFGTDVDDV